jgi:hypothetical protein
MLIGILERVFLASALHLGPWLGGQDNLYYFLDPRIDYKIIIIRGVLDTSALG